jgi:hypothetical protein
MLKPLPVQHPEEMVEVTMGNGLALNNSIWEQIRDKQDVFSGVFAYGMWAFNLAPGVEVHNRRCDGSDLFRKNPPRRQ